MKLFLLLIVCICVNTGITQNKIKSPYSIGASLSSFYSYRTLDVDPIDSYKLEWYYGFREARESYRIGFSGEIDLSYQMTKFFKLMTGVNYFERGYKLKNQILHEEQGIFLIGIIDATYDINSFGIPLKLEFETNDSSLFSFFLNGGVNFEYRFKSQYSMKFVESYGIVNLDGKSFMIGSEQWFHPETAYLSNDFSLAGLLDLGIKLNLNEKVSLSFAATTYYNFNSVLQEPIKENLYGIGIKVGGIYSL